MGKPGSFLSSPRRRRGGGRGARLGGVARGGGIQRGVEWVQEVAGVPRVAVEQQEVSCGPPRWVSPTPPRRRDVTPAAVAAIAPPCVFIDIRPVALPDLRPPRLLYLAPVSRVVSHPDLSSTCFNRGIVPRRGIVPAPIGRRSIAGSIGSPMINCRIHMQSLFAAIGWVLRHLLINSVNGRSMG